MYELIFSVQELIFPVQEFRSKSHMPLSAVEKSHMPSHAKHKRSNMAATMAARTGRISVICERNERGFRHFLQKLKAGFRLFLTPNNVQLTANALTEAKHHLLGAKGTLSLLMNDLVGGDPNLTGVPTNAIQAPPDGCTT